MNKWSHSFLRHLMAIIVVITSVRCARAALEMPPQTAEAFRLTTLSESGGLASTGDHRDIVVDYVNDNWKDLLDHLDEVPTRSGTVRAAVMIVGAASEELPPMEYLDFLDHYLTVYARGKIKDDMLRMQLAGDNRKNYFITVNSAHPRVRSLLLRAKELVPKENTSLQEYLDEEIAGKRSDLYLANEPDDARPPETLPGIKLKTPFEELIAKAHRFHKSSDRATKHGPTSGGNSGTPGEDRGVSGDKSSVRAWFVVAALAVLVFAMWRAVKKRGSVNSG